MAMEQANGGDVVALGGGSNANGGAGTGKSSIAFIDDDRFTYWVDGALVSGDWPNPSSIVPGFADELLNELGLESLTVVQRGVPSTTLGTWTTVHAPALVSDAATAGVVPGSFIHMYGGGDAQDAPSMNAVDANATQMLAVLQRAWGPGLGIVNVGMIPTPDVSPYTFAGGIPHGFGWGTWDAQKDYATRRPKLMDFIDGRPFAAALRVHYEVVEKDALGRAIARLMWANGVFTRT